MTIISALRLDVDLSPTLNIGTPSGSPDTLLGGQGAGSADTIMVPDGGGWRLLCEAYNEDDGWRQATSAMQIPQGCLVRVSHIRGDNVSESVTFVPHARVSDDENGARIIKERT